MYLRYIKVCMLTLVLNVPTTHAIAKPCWINVVVQDSNYMDKVVHLDPIKIESSDGILVDDQYVIRDESDAFANAHLNEILELLGKPKIRVYSRVDIHCYPSAAAVIARKIMSDESDTQYVPEPHVRPRFHGVWGQAISGVTEASQPEVKIPKKDVAPPVLQRVYSNQAPAEKVENTGKLNEARSKRKAEESSALSAKQAEDKVKAQDREKAARAVCMKAENRDLCSCRPYFPALKGGSCSR